MSMITMEDREQELSVRREGVTDRRPEKVLANFKKEYEFFIGIDSDGCAFDTMEIKHKECFCPQTVRFWNLQAVSKYARQTWEFVNLYSLTRGTNRFLALQATIGLLAKREEVRSRRVRLPELQALEAWTDRETRLGEPALREYARTVRDPVIDTVLAWSEAVNASIREIVSGVPPFPLVRESLEKIKTHADLMVVSQTPLDALEREWREHDLDGHIRVLAGQEYGSKTEHLRFAAGGKYAPGKMLMVGDAWGDLQAAEDNGMLFFPVIPGKEIESWERFHGEGCDRFFKGRFAGGYEDKLIREFTAALPAVPPWEKR